MSYKKLYSTPEYTPIEIDTDAGMTAVLTSENEGKVFKFTGTTGTYTNGDLYEVEEGPSSFTLTLGSIESLSSSMDVYVWIKINSAPSGTYDYDSQASPRTSTWQPTETSAYTDVTKIYVWSDLPGAKIKINSGTDITVPDTYSSALELTLSEDSTISATVYYCD